MRINILATLGRRPGGAHRNFLEYADRLTRRGHRVTVIKAIHTGGRKAGFATRARQWLFLHTGAPRRPYRVAWLRCSAEIVAVPSYQEEYLPAADATLFSSTRLIETVAGFSDRSGAKLMRVADIFFARRPPAVPAGIRLVATSSLVRELLLERFPERKIPLLLNGVNLELFRNPDRPSRPARRIGFLFYQKRPAHKGLEDAVAALERLRSEFPGLEFACAGFRRERWLPGWIKFFPGQDQAALARFYAGLDVFIFPSRADASPNPPLEAMACRCAVVSTETGGYGDFLLPGITALTVPAGQPQALAAAVRRLLLEPGLLERLAAAGYRKACELSVENQAVRLEGILLAAAGERP